MYQEGGKVLITATSAPATCQINIKPGCPGEKKAVAYCLDLTLKGIPSCADFTWKGNELILQGAGYDGRCASCRHFRRSLQKQSIWFSCRCPLEIQDNSNKRRVIIGSAFFDQGFLEDEKQYLAYQRRVKNNPRDLEAHLALGVIHEYHGRFAPALASYWAAYELDPEDAFIGERLQRILSLLQHILQASGQQPGHPGSPPAAMDGQPG